MLSTVATIGIAIAGALFVVLWLTSPSYDPEEPPPIAHQIPVLGHAYQFMFNRGRFLNSCMQKSGGQPFSMLIAGRKHYVFSSLTDITAVHRNSKSLSIRELVRMLHTSLFGMTVEGAALLNDRAEGLHDINNKHLLRPENNAATASKYYMEVAKILDALHDQIMASDSKSITMDGLKVVNDVQGVASTVAYYGERLLEMHPAALDDLTIWVGQGFWPMLCRAPRWWCSSAYEARDRLAVSFRRLRQEMETSGTAMRPLFQERIEAQRGWAADEDTITLEVMSIFFGLNGNSIPTAYLMFLNVISQPGLVAAIRAELTQAGYSEMSPADHGSLIPSQLPLLRSVFWENMRMHNVASSIREVLEPTELSGSRTWSLKKGGVVTMPAGLLHKNPAIHPEPHVFRPRRFMDVELGGDGENHTKTLKPFGGGTSYCPGRVFAEKQVMAFVAGMCSRFDMRIVSPKWELPENTDFELVARCPSISIELKVRAT